MNIIDAIINLINKPVTELVTYYQSQNRANSAGDALEEYVKDLFANSFDLDNDERSKRIHEVFSYVGNNSNPPDAMLKDGDAIEVKKISTYNADLALNSSFPEQVLSSSNPMIDTECRTAETWDKKDLIYCVGVVHKNKLKHLCMVYGLDYCASEETYLKIKKVIKNGVESIPNVTFSKTKELGRINQIDPLKATSLRVRGMWILKNPWVLFEKVYKRNSKKKLNFMCIINEEKWNSLPNKELLCSIKKPELSISDIDIPIPDDPLNKRKAKLISFYVE